MSSEPAIRCTGIGKAFQLYAHQNDQLKQILFGLWKKFYKEKWVLHDMTFTVEKGERVGIIGRNGAGKTTLLQIICGITMPTKGEFKVQGRIAPILALGSGFDGLLTGRENARIGAAILGLSKKEVDARIEDIAAFADVGPFFEQPMRTYSMGMIARVAFAICAHADANVLIVDEALSVGDQIFQHKCERYIEDFAHNGTILMVSHDLDFLEKLCDRVLWLENGVVKEIGEPARIIADYRAAMDAEENQATGA
ncbi:ABC transporter ATP-binding protein [Methylocystis parvus]|uniref:ABC transporter ATP-binding protein n=1 Tax=Methylocystis parvus TaxID=134 RepID=A0A6B8M7D5_9HYPH|nr:ABC transporter ATP-binding protein [Methylocystis parvus]QGM98285.1 ABC transporter ATP-binding protein [Methylocystis parvus]WBK01389.1 ABC transporter ATP-binding protein [Methylocystis parvus OBBP]